MQQRVPFGLVIACAALVGLISACTGVARIPGGDDSAEAAGGASAGGAASNRAGASGASGGVSGGTSPPADPGTVTARRLNRVELQHTIRDLLGVDRDVTQGFPADNTANGFDNGGDVLGFSTVHADLWRKMASGVLDEALGSAERPGPARARVFSCDPSKDGDACTRTILRAFARRAWRRPVSEDETARLQALAARGRELGLDAAAAVKHALAGVLVSPLFVYRFEVDPDPTAKAARALTGHELATRLSYFLWASTPDDALLDLADKGALATDDAVVAQVRRMIGDGKSVSLAQDFAGQWLQTRAVEVHEADPRFPLWTKDLARSARTEIELSFDELLDKDRPLGELLTADWSYVDDRLAAFYGLGGSGAGFRRVTMPAERRAGLLGKAGFLAVTSYPDRTSIVKRGVWTLAQLLCSAPPPPKDGAAVFDPSKVPADAPLRKRMEIHRANPECAACHNVIDPIGLGLEKFDAIGRFRTLEGSTPIDDSGRLPDGTAFAGAVALGAALAGDERLTGCIARQTLTYAIGRGMRADDDAAVERVVAATHAGGGHFRALIEAVALSAPFRTRRPGVAP